MRHWAWESYWLAGGVLDFHRRPRSLVIHLSLCGAVLAYVLAQYRLFGLTTSLFGTALLIDRRFPRWLGGLAIANCG